MKEAERRKKKIRLERFEIIAETERTTLFPKR